MGHEPGSFVLPERDDPVPDRTGLDAPYWTGVAREELVVQRCQSCGSWQWGPEWTCYVCRSFNMQWQEVPREDGEYRGVIYSWERVWHASDPALAGSVPYVAVLVTLPRAGNVRMIGNLLGDQRAPVSIGSRVRAVFEHHERYSLVQWQRG
jgi:uncharacterized protein